MVLVKVVQLVVHVDGGGDVVLDVEFEDAVLAQFALIIVLLGETLNALAHDVESDAQREENHTKDTKDDHGRAEGWHGSPSRQHLLLKLALLKFIDLFLDASEVFF